VGSVATTKPEVLTWRDDLVRRLARLGLRAEREAEIVEELSQHLDDHVRELVAGGTTADDARRLALAELDEPGRLEQRLADIEARSPLHLPPPGAAARGRRLRAVWQDARYAVASLRRTPALTITVVAALALTIGPATAILSVGNWLLLRPPPGVVQSDRLAVLFFGDWNDDGSVSPRRISALNLADLRGASRTIVDLAGWQESSASVAADGVVPRRAGSAHTSVNLFNLLGVRPAVGRPFANEDDVPPFGSPVAILGDALARSLFGSPGQSVGRSVIVNGRRLEVVGVMPPGFVGAYPDSQVEVWFPSSTYYYVNHFAEELMRSRMGRGTGGYFYKFVVRLAPDATFPALRAEVDVLVPALVERFPDDNRNLKLTRARVYPRLGPSELLRDRYRELVAQLLIVGGVLLVLGCANVANLLISQGIRRQHERAIRIALGASRSRLVQLLLTESCVLAVAGAALGVGVAVVLKELIRTLMLPPASGGVDPVVPLDLPVLLTTLGLSITCGIVAGLAPAWIGSSIRVGRGLATGDRRTAGGRTRLRAGFAVVQLALSLALVTNATLLVATLRSLSEVDLGFNPRGVSLHGLDLASHGYSPDRIVAFNRQLLEALSTERSISSVSLSPGYPPGGTLGTRLIDPKGGPRSTIAVTEEYITDDYFRTLEISLVSGRTFMRAETVENASAAGAPAILSEALARRLFGSANPIGQLVGRPGNRLEPQQDLVVVGVVRDVRDMVPREANPALYTPLASGTAFSRRPNVLIRSDRPLKELGDLVQKHVTALDPALPVSPPRLLTTAVERQLANRRVFAWVLSLLGALGFVLAAVGLYGLLAQMVNERTREFGIRMAIGADPAHIFGLVFRQAAWIAAIGGAAGLGLAAVGSRLVEAQLFGVTRLEPRIYLAAATGLALIVFLATVWPARSATRIQPVEALRAE
jgi:predicted permease